MTALTRRLPAEKFNRLKALAKQRWTRLNRLIDEMTRLMLAEFDTETRFGGGPSADEGKRRWD